MTSVATSAASFVSAPGGDYFVDPDTPPTPPSPSPPPPKGAVLPHPYLQQNPGLQLHPDFPATADGDVIVVCHDGQREVGFRVLGNVLRASSGVFVQELAKAAVQRSGMIFSPDAAADMHAVLRFLYAGHPRFGPGPFSPTLPQYLSLLAFVAAYAPPPSLRTMLHAMAERDAAILARGDLHQLIEVAHRVRSEALWAEIIQVAPAGSVLHDPWGADMGFQLWSVLLLIARVRGLGVPMDEVVVTYPDARTIAVAARDGRVRVEHALV